MIFFLFGFFSAEFVNFRLELIFFVKILVNFVKCCKKMRKVYENLQNFSKKFKKI